MLDGPSLSLGFFFPLWSSIQSYADNEGIFFFLISNLELQLSVQLSLKISEDLKWVSQN